MYKTKETDMQKLGGMMVATPKSALLVLLAGLAMAGVPPFNAFQSKLMLVQAVFKFWLTRTCHNNGTTEYCDIHDIYESIPYHLPTTKTC